MNIHAHAHAQDLQRLAQLFLFLGLQIHLSAFPAPRFARHDLVNHVIRCVAIPRRADGTHGVVDFIQERIQYKGLPVRKGETLVIQQADCRRYFLGAACRFHGDLQHIGAHVPAENGLCEFVRAVHALHDGEGLQDGGR